MYFLMNENTHTLFSIHIMSLTFSELIIKVSNITGGFPGVSVQRRSILRHDAMHRHPFSCLDSFNLAFQQILEKMVYFL